MSIKQEDLRWETFTFAGILSAEQNRIESEVKCTHMPTGTVIRVAVYPAQHRNRALAVELMEKAVEKGWGSFEVNSMASSTDTLPLRMRSLSKPSGSQSESC